MQVRCTTPKLNMCSRLNCINQSLSALWTMHVRMNIQSHTYTDQHRCVRNNTSIHKQTCKTTDTFIVQPTVQCAMPCFCHKEGRPTSCPAAVASSCALWTKDLVGSFGACCLVPAGQALYTKSVSGSRVISFHTKPVSSCSTRQI